MKLTPWPLSSFCAFCSRSSLQIVLLQVCRNSAESIFSSFPHPNPDFEKLSDSHWHAGWWHVREWLPRCCVGKGPQNSHNTSKELKFTEWSHLICTVPQRAGHWVLLYIMVHTRSNRKVRFQSKVVFTGSHTEWTFIPLGQATWAPVMGKERSIPGKRGWARSEAESE